jgi:hypothetical protein
MLYYRAAGWLTTPDFESWCVCQVLNAFTFPLCASSLWWGKKYIHIYTINRFNEYQIYNSYKKFMYLILVKNLILSTVPHGNETMAIVNSEYHLMFSFICTSDTSGIIVNHCSVTNLCSPWIKNTNKIYFVQNCQLPHCWCHIINVKMVCVRFSVVTLKWGQSRCRWDQQVRRGVTEKENNWKWSCT